MPPQSRAQRTVATTVVGYLSGAPQREASKMTDDSPAEERSSVLRIHFRRGERPHLFWVGKRGGVGKRDDDARPHASLARSDVPARGVHCIKILSKRRADGAVEVVVVEEAPGRRRALARVTLASDAPSGALAHWVRGFGESLGIELQCFDLRDVSTSEAWSERARALGWQCE